MKTNVRLPGFAVIHVALSPNLAKNIDNLCSSVYNKALYGVSEGSPLHNSEDGMKVQVENLDSVRRKVEVLLPRETIAAIREGVYDEIKKHAKIKGIQAGEDP